LAAPRTPSALSRRTLLAGIGAGATLAACGRTVTPVVEPSTEPSGAPPPSQEDLVGRALAAVDVDAPIRLTPILFVPEVLTGPDRHLQFGIVDVDQQGQPGLELDVWFIDKNGAVAAGPYQPAFHAREDIPPSGGLYHALVELETPGTYDLVIATRDRSVAGAGVVQVVSPSQTTFVAPGTAFPSVATPTLTAPMDVADICTRDPECPLHEISLDKALTSGRPTVVTVSSVAHCATALCAPALTGVVELFDALHEEHHVKFGGHEDGVQWLSGPNFVHVEPFVDAAGTESAPLAKALGLGSDPWTWVIGADGIVLDRIGGPITAAVLRARIDALCPDTNCIDPNQASEEPTEPASSESEGV
jgi:hypothetical protein